MLIKRATAADSDAPWRCGVITFQCNLNTGGSEAEQRGCSGGIADVKMNE